MNSSKPFIIITSWTLIYTLGAVLLILYLLVSDTKTSDIFASITNSQSKEGFNADRVPSGEYPREVNEPLLYPTYPKKLIDYGVVLSKNNSYSSSKLYPSVMNVEANKYDQATNNVRDWLTPDNGSCKPSAFCGALYDPKAPEEYKVPEPLPFNTPEKRVGYYAATRL